MRFSVLPGDVQGRNDADIPHEKLKNHHCTPSQAVAWAMGAMMIFNKKEQ